MVTVLVDVTSRIPIRQQDASKLRVKITIDMHVSADHIAEKVFVRVCGCLYYVLVEAWSVGTAILQTNERQTLISKMKLDLKLGLMNLGKTCSVRAGVTAYVK